MKAPPDYRSSQPHKPRKPKPGVASKKERTAADRRVKVVVLNYLVISLGVLSLLALVFYSYYIPLVQKKGKDAGTETETGTGTGTETGTEAAWPATGSKDWLAPDPKLFKEDRRVYLQEYFKGLRIKSEEHRAKLIERGFPEERITEFPAEDKIAEAIEGILADMETVKDPKGAFSVVLRELDNPARTFVFHNVGIQLTRPHMFPGILGGLVVLLALLVFIGYRNFWQGGSDRIGFHTKTPWGILSLLQFFCIWAIFTLAGLLVVKRIIPEGTDAVFSGRAALVVNLISKILVCIVLLFLVRTHYRSGLKTLGVRRFGIFKNLQLVIVTALVFIVFYLLYLPISWVATYVTFVSGFPLEAQNVMEIFFREPERSFKILFIVIAVAVAPLTEELWFRSFMLSGIKRRFGGIAAILITAVLFAAIHPGVFVKVPILMVGLMAGIIYLRTQSYLAAVLFHAMFNAIPFILMYGLLGSRFGL